MSDDTRTQPLPPGILRVMVLGPRDLSRWQDEIFNAPGGRAIVWAGHDAPEQDYEKLVRSAADSDVAVVTLASRGQNIAELQRWAWLASQLGVPRFVITVERTDLPQEGRKGFDRMTGALSTFIKQRCSFRAVTTIPISSVDGGNLAKRDSRVGWYMGPTLLEYLNEIAKETANFDQKAAVDPAVVSDHIQARVFWLNDAPLLPWRPLKMHTATGVYTATVTSIKYELDPHATERIVRNRLNRGDIGVCNVSTTESATLQAFAADRSQGLFALRDPTSDACVGLGLVGYALHRSSNIQWQHTTVTPKERAAQKEQDASVVWFTGLSGAGKSTIADLVEKRLKAAGKHTMLLDGDNVRHGLNKDLGFTDVDRVENIRRIAEVSKLMCDAGLIVLVSFISPFQSERSLARATVGDHGFHEVYVATSLAVAEERDVKGLYAKARRGEIKNFTGIDSPYEPPENPEITVDTETETAEAAAERIVKELFDA